MIWNYLKNIFSKKGPSMEQRRAEWETAYRKEQRKFLVEKPLVGVICASWVDYLDFCEVQNLNPHKFGYRHNNTYRFKSLEVGTMPFLGLNIDYIVATKKAHEHPFFGKAVYDASLYLPPKKFIGYFDTSTCPDGLENYGLIGKMF